MEDVLHILPTGLANHVASVFGILVGAYLVQKLAGLLVGRVVRKSVRSHHHESRHEEEQRETTMISVLRTGIRVVVWLVALMMVVGEFGVDIAPLLAGAGVLGVALGFGAQSMIKDYLAGIFILAENQYRVGDVLQVNQGVSGVVERVTLRATVLRDLDGIVHYIPNGVVEIASNMTMEYSSVNLDIGIAYGTDIDKLEKVINRVGQEMLKDPVWGEVIIEAPEMLRVDAFADSAIIVKIVSKTAPMRQWDVKGELMRRLKKAFEKADIEIPFPQRVMHSAKK